MIEFKNYTKNQLEDVKARFWSKVKSTPKKAESCWVWNASKDPQGYGLFRLIGKKTRRAPRLSWELSRGEIPYGKLVLHKCDNPPCVRPDHLYLGTHKDNSHDAIERRRTAKGEDVSTAKLTEADVVEIRRAYRTGNYSQRDLAARFNVALNNIHCIITRKTWKHVT